MSTGLLTLDQQLIGVVTRLARSHDVAVTASGGRLLGTRRDLALISQLRLAIASSLGSGGTGSGRAARERVPLDLGARELLDSIVGYLRENYGRETDYHRGKRPSPEAMLWQWHLRFIERFNVGSVSAEVVENELSILEQFEKKIMNKLDPAPTMEIVTPCPLCEQTKVLLPDTGEEVYCLRVSQADPVSDSVAVCLNCGALWKGISESTHGLPTLRDLRIAIDDRIKNHPVSKLIE